MGPRAGLDTEAKGKVLSPLPGIEPLSPGRQSVARHCTDNQEDQNSSPSKQSRISEDCHGIFRLSAQF
jgi:hypothetical protein